jgi:cytochrome P450
VEDDVCLGYEIPAGTTVLASHWAIHMDPEMYNDPEQFIPERWETESTPAHFAFGFGPRGCPGQQLAIDTLYIAIATVLWALEISGKERSDEQQSAMDDTLDSDGFLAKPLPFECDISARDEWRVADVQMRLEAKSRDVEDVLHPSYPPILDL